MFGRDNRTKLPSIEKIKEKLKAKDNQNHHKTYKQKIKHYADKTIRAKEHNFDVGDIVYIVSMENGKLDAKFRDTHTMCYCDKT